MFTFTPSEELLERWVRVTDQLTTHKDGWTRGHARIANETREEDRVMLTDMVRNYLITLGHMGGESGMQIATRSCELLPKIVNGLYDRFGYGRAPEAEDITRLFSRDVCAAINRDARITSEIYVKCDVDGYRVYGPEPIRRVRTRPKVIILE